MSTRRLAAIPSVPPSIKKVFNNAPEPVTPEERLWRERVARMTLDALGHTNLTTKPRRHNETVRYARRWYRGLFKIALEQDHPNATFDAAGLIGFAQVRDAVLIVRPFLFLDKDDDNGKFEG